MREITFRGKRLDNGEWVQGDSTQWLDAIYISADNENRYSKTNWLVEPETVGQFTGVTDVNGRKIFEGDIVKFTLDDEIEEETVIDYASIKYNSEHLRFYLDWVEFFETPLIPEDGKELEVVGNIYDNPELLGGDDNGNL